MHKLALAIFAALACASCSTPYQDMGLLGGVRATQIDAITLRITARGNAFTDHDQINNYVLRKAAEETLKHGYNLFQIVSDKDRTRNEVYSSTTPGQPTLSYGPSGEFVYGETGGHTSVGSYTKPGEEILVKMMSGIRPPLASPDIYDANEVLSYLAPGTSNQTQTVAVQSAPAVAEPQEVAPVLPACTAQDRNTARLAKEQGYQYHLNCR